jgi:hypothetical protein
MDKFIIERRARIRLGWFKRDEKRGNISQVYLRTYQAPEHKTSLCWLTPGSMADPKSVAFFQRLHWRQCVATITLNNRR